MYLGLFEENGHVRTPIATTTRNATSKLFPTIGDCAPLIVYRGALCGDLVRTIPVVGTTIRGVVQLANNFSIRAKDSTYSGTLTRFLSSVPYSSNREDVCSFLSACFRRLLVCNATINRVLASRCKGVHCLCGTEPSSIDLLESPGSFSEVLMYHTSTIPAPMGRRREVLFATLSTRPNSLCNASILCNLPFMDSMLLGVFRTAGSG